MKPILFSFGNFHLYSFGAMVFIGLVLSLYLMERRAKLSGFPAGDMVFDLVFVVVGAGFLGGRIAYVIENREIYLQNPLGFFAFWEGGLIFYGGMISSVIGLSIFGRIKKISLLKILDFLLPYTALTHAFGRIGCFLNGCCGGRACDLPWAVRFPDEAVAVHPTQLYETAWNLVLFAFLYSIQVKGKSREGSITYLYFFFYGLGRFVVEFFRSGNPFWGALTANQWMSIAIMAASALFALAGKKGIRHAGS